MKAVYPHPSKTFVATAAILLCAAFPALARGDGEEPKDRGNITAELEGLAPGPRIAYLRHLISGGGDDAEVRFQLGLAFHEGGEADSAMHEYRRAVALDPSLAKAYVNMGVLYDEGGRPEDALDMFETAIDVRPDDLLAHAHAAAVLLGLKRYDEAWRFLERSLAIDPLAPQPHYNLALFFWECGMFRETLAEWERVVELAPESPLAREAELNIMRIQRMLSEAASSDGMLQPERR